MMLTQEQIDNWNTPRLVGITGKAGSGKSTAADFLVQNGWMRIKMAGPLKDMLRVLGLTDRHIEGDLKEVPCDLLGGQTPRHAMITLGTEWGRQMIANDLWVNAARARIEAVLREGRNVVVDDVRFENEAEVIRKLGGKVLEIRRGSGVVINHESEQGVAPDMTCYNEGSLAELRGYMAYVFGVNALG